MSGADRKGECTGEARLYEITCPHCAAKPGEKCVDFLKREVPSGHQARWVAAVEDVPAHPDAANLLIAPDGSVTRADPILLAAGADSDGRDRIRELLEDDAQRSSDARDPGRAMCTCGHAAYAHLNWKDGCFSGQCSCNAFECTEDHDASGNPCPRTETALPPDFRAGWSAAFEAFGGEGPGTVEEAWRKRSEGVTSTTVEGVADETSAPAVVACVTPVSLDAPSRATESNSPSATSATPAKSASHNNAERCRPTATAPSYEPPLLETLKWLYTVVEHECPPPDRPHEGSCHPDAGCDGTCSDAYYHSVEMTKARYWIAKLEGRPGEQRRESPTAHIGIGTEKFDLANSRTYRLTIPTVNGDAVAELEGETMSLRVGDGPWQTIVVSKGSKTRKA